jgi:uncharacterized membrane protein (UPF0136 family)
MSFAVTASYTYGILLLIGGIAGAAKGSAASLIAAGGAAAAILGLEQLVPRASWATVAGTSQLAIAGALAFTMYGRFSRSGKFMPAGLVASLSAAMFLVYGSRVLALASGAAPKRA